MDKTVVCRYIQLTKNYSCTNKLSYYQLIWSYESNENYWSYNFLWSCGIRSGQDINGFYEDDKQHPSTGVSLRFWHDSQKGRYLLQCILFLNNRKFWKCFNFYQIIIIVLFWLIVPTTNYPRYNHWPIAVWRKSWQSFSI